MEILGITSTAPNGKAWHRQKPNIFAQRALANDIKSVRLPVSYQNQKHLPGYFWMSRMNRLVAYESRLEMTTLLQLDFNRTIRHVVSQPFVLHYQDKAKIYRHTPDFLAIYINGAAEIINVKPRQFIQAERNRRAFSACKDVAIEMGWAYSTRCEIDPVLLANLKWLAGFRKVPPRLAEIKSKLLDVAKEPVAIGDAIRAVKTTPAMVRPVLFHLIWTGVLEADLFTRMNDATLLVFVTLTQGKGPT